MEHDNAVVWLGSRSSAIEYFELSERAHRMVEANPGIVQANSRMGKTEERFGDYGDMIQAVGNVAIVPIEGAMRSKGSWMTRMFGIMTYDTISNIMATLVADGGIDTVVLDIDSPGGQAKGVDTAVDAIQAAKDAGLTVVSHTAGSMASAAYWIGSTADVVASTESAEVGSIGVIAVHQEESERNKKEGINVTVLRKGEEKALATPFEKLSDKARAQIEESMDRAYNQFVGAVSANRGIPHDFVKERIATGAVFGSQEALELGMIDEVIAYNDLVSRYVKADQSSQPGAGNSNWSEAAMHKQPIVKAGGLSPEEAAIAVAAGADPKSLIPRIKAESTEEEGEEAAEVTVVEGSGDAEGEEGSETPEGEEGTEDAKAGEAAVVTAKADISGFQTMISSLNEQLIESKIEARNLAAKVEELKSGNVGLRQIAIEQTQRLRVSLGMPDDVSDLGLMSDAALVTAHRSNLTQFMERFNIGAVSQLTDKDTKLSAENVTRLEQARLKTTRI